jgi:hypothetical protein
LLVIATCLRYTETVFSLQDKGTDLARYKLEVCIKKPAQDCVCNTARLILISIKVQGFYMELYYMKAQLWSDLIWT